MRLPVLAACLLLAIPAVAQDPKGGDNEIQQRGPLSDQVPGTPEGDLVSKPAQGAAPPDAPRQPARPSGDRAATSARTMTTDEPVAGDDAEKGDATTGGAGRGDADVDVTRTAPPPNRSTGAPTTPSATQAEQPRQAESFRGDRGVGPNAGGATGTGRVYADDLRDYTVHLSDREEFGKVSRVVVDLESGRLQGLEVSTGGVLGVGDQRFDIPWDAVAAVNTGTRELRVAISQQQVQGQPEAFNRPPGNRE